MSIAIDPHHLHYFRKNRQIEFENLVSSSEIGLINTIIKKKVENAKGALPLPLKEGFDLWRTHEELKKLIAGKKFAKMSGQLMEVQKLRFGYSQFLSSNCYSDEYSYVHRKSCIQELIVGLCICLEPSPTPENPYFPSEKGHGIFFEIDPDFFLRYPKSRGEYLFIFYTHPSATYSFQPEDPLNGFFRVLGYEHGDRLKETLNPSYSWMLI